LADQLKMVARMIATVPAVCQGQVFLSHGLIPIDGGLVNVHPADENRG
jgi:hypothetical protein